MNYKHCLLGVSLFCSIFYVSGSELAVLIEAESVCALCLGTVEPEEGAILPCDHLCHNECLPTDENCIMCEERSKEQNLLLMGEPQEEELPRRSTCPPWCKSVFGDTPCKVALSCLIISVEITFVVGFFILLTPR